MQLSDKVQSKIRDRVLEHLETGEQLEYTFLALSQAGLNAIFAARWAKQKHYIIGVTDRGLIVLNNGLSYLGKTRSVVRLPRQRIEIGKKRTALIPVQIDQTYYVPMACHEELRRAGESLNRPE
jgi:hypothetical protein